MARGQTYVGFRFMESHETLFKICAPSLPEEILAHGQKNGADRDLYLFLEVERKNIVPNVRVSRKFSIMWDVTWVTWRTN